MKKYHKEIKEKKVNISDPIIRFNFLMDQSKQHKLNLQSLKEK